MRHDQGTNPAPFKGTPARGTNQSGMRAHNERLVLSLIRNAGPQAKAEIARATGLSAQSVSVIMRSLEADGLLTKCDPVRGKVGQPSVPMRLATRGAFFLGLKVGRRSVELVLIDFLGQVVERAFETYAYPTPEAAISFVRENLDAVLGTLDQSGRARVAGMGIAMPYFLWKWADFLGVPEQKMASWRHVDLRAEIAANLDFPVFVQNDASAACGAELVFGPADRSRDFLYFYIGYFIGGGVVLNGAMFTGRGNAGAMGPLPVPSPNGALPLIEIASLSGLESQLNAKGIDTDHMWTEVDTWDFDTGILDQWIAKAAQGLASAIVAGASIIDFGEVLIDGRIPADLRATLVDQVNDELDRRDWTGLSRPAVNQGTIGPDARAIGAASMPLSERFLVD